MLVWRDRRFLLGCTLLAGALLAGCGSKSLNPAPVEDRTTGLAKPATPAPVAETPPSPAAPARVPPGAENAGKPGYYTVKPGDTLIRIGLDNGQNFKDIARWNNLENPNQLEVGQVLRVVPPTGGAVVTAVKPSGTTPVPAPAASAPATAAVKPPAVAAAGGADDDINWIWPATGAVTGNFDGTKNLGIDIDGKAGDPVLASADGTVVYVGAAVRAYGNLIILKHNNSYVTAYAHNQTLLVKEDQAVKKGQKIAEMGSSDADRVKLHFELRRLGKAVDPVKYLPAR